MEIWQPRTHFLELIRSRVSEYLHILHNIINQEKRYSPCKLLQLQQLFFVDQCHLSGGQQQPQTTQYRLLVSKICGATSLEIFRKPPSRGRLTRPSAPPARKNRADTCICAILPPASGPIYTEPLLTKFQGAIDSSTTEPISSIYTLSKLHKVPSQP